MLDLLVKNALIVDGTGKEPYQGAVGVANGAIVETTNASEAKTVIDAAGRVVAPGFIDAHSHGDLILGEPFAQLCKTSQGVTTEIAGQCGFSMSPVNPEYLDLLQGLLTVGAVKFPAEMKNWTTYPRYLEYVATVPKSANIKMYVGHSTLRVSVMGFANRKATAEELEKMKALLKEAMECGALGLSTGLIYTPSCYADTEEIVELAKVIAPYGGIYASHMRNESHDSLKSINEVLEVGRKAGVAVCISHHKILGKANWGLQKETLKLIEDAVKEGIRVTCDQYPYACNMTHLSACIPPWHFDKGLSAMAAKLRDPENRKSIRREMEDPKSEYDNYYLNAGGWSGVLVCACPKTPRAEGKYVADYAKELGCDPFDAFFDIMVENNGESTAVYSSMCDEDVFEIALAPNTIVGTDGLTRSAGEKGHPRAYGSFPRAINYYVKENGVMTLEQCIRKMTSLTAARLGLKKKGVIAPGYDADLVVFNPDNLMDKATYSDSCAITEGMDYVIVNGEVVYKDQQFTGVYPGRFIPHTK